MALADPKAQINYSGTPVTCPCGCDYTFMVQRSPKGSKAAKRWIVLPEKNVQLLAWWWSNHHFDWLTKNQILKEFPINPDPLSGRISELYGLDLVIRHASKTDKHHIVSYSLNHAKVQLVLNSGGNLNVLRKQELAA